MKYGRWSVVVLGCMYGERENGRSRGTCLYCMCWHVACFIDTGLYSVGYIHITHGSCETNPLPLHPIQRACTGSVCIPLQSPDSREMGSIFCFNTMSVSSRAQMGGVDCLNRSETAGNAETELISDTYTVVHLSVLHTETIKSRLLSYRLMFDIKLSFKRF